MQQQRQRSRSAPNSCRDLASSLLAFRTCGCPDAYRYTCTFQPTVIRAPKSERVSVCEKQKLFLKTNKKFINTCVSMQDAWSFECVASTLTHTHTCERRHVAGGCAIKNARFWCVMNWRRVCVPFCVKSVPDKWYEVQEATKRKRKQKQIYACMWKSR